MKQLFPRGWRIIRPPRHAQAQSRLYPRPIFSPEFGGTGVIADNLPSTVTTEDGQAVSRRVLLIRRDNFRPAADTWSDADGHYRFTGLSLKHRFIVMVVDNEIGDTKKCDYAPDAWDFVAPEER